MHKSVHKILLLLIASQFSMLYSQFDINENKYNIYAVNLPEKISFANETTPLHDDNIKERLDKELLINTYWQSKTILLIKRANKYFPIIEKILMNHNIPDDFKYLAVAESGLENTTSPSGAKGFWQFLKKTGIEYELEINSEIDERYHLEKSTKAACQYLQEAYDLFGSWTLAAAAYNMGKNGLLKNIKKQKVNSYYDLMLNSETHRYVFRILAIKEIISNHQEYGFIINADDYYNHPQYYTTNIDTSITNIADFGIKLGLNYKKIKELNPWILGNTITNEDKKTYQLKIMSNSKPKQSTIDTIYHTCQARENIFEISRKYNVDVNEILKWNNLLPSKKIKKNQKIIILKSNEY
tara:strand:+ start:430 stop:1491 length:1062 start_codon:yes stop_codon:yes gene_type:complete